MDRRKKLATAGAVSLTATAAVVALGASVGLFGLTEDNPRVGKLSPIDATHATSSTTPDVQTIIVDDAAPATPGGTAGDDRSGSSSNTTSNTPSNTAPHADDRTQTTVITSPSSDDHGDDRSGDVPDDSGPGSTSSGRDHDEDD